MTMATILSNVTAFVTEAISWVTAFVTCITGQPLLPLLLMFVIVAFVGLGVGLIKRLVRV